MTRDEALHIVIAIEKTNRGFTATEVLVVMATNLEFTPIGNWLGQTVSYDPIKHEDISGGLLPGDLVLIDEVGWAYKGENLLRAKVRKKFIPASSCSETERH